MMIYNTVFWVQLGSLVFVFISAPIYLYVIGTLIYYRRNEPHFKNSFFLVWISLGFSDLAHSVVFWVSGKLPLMGFFSSFFLNAGEGIAKCLMTASFVTHFAQVLGIVLMSINRLTALLFPAKSEPFWARKRVVPSCIAAVWALSLILSFPVIFMEQNWLQTNNQSKVAFHFISLDLASPYMFVVGFLLAIVTLATVGVYIFMFYKVQKMSVEQKKALKTQLKLAMCAFFVAVFLALLSVFFCLFSFYSVSISWGDNAVLFFVSCDLNTFCNVYLLLGTSKVVRRKVCMSAKRMFCCSAQVEPVGNTRFAAASSQRGRCISVAHHGIRGNPYGTRTNTRMMSTRI